MRDPTGEQSKELIEQIVQQIARWRLTLPASLFLEVTKPFSFLAGQGLLLCEPVLSFLYKEPRVADYADLLSDRSNLEHLIARLERESPSPQECGEEEG
jgi:hypothetical protein